MNGAANLNNDAAVQRRRASGYYESERRFFFLVLTRLHGTHGAVSILLCEAVRTRDVF